MPRRNPFSSLIIVCKFLETVGRQMALDHLREDIEIPFYNLINHPDL